MCVSIATGEVTLSATDFDFPNLIPLGFGRTYRSTSPKAGVLGHGWRHTFECYARFEATGISVWGPGDEDPTLFELVAAGEETSAGEGPFGTKKLQHLKSALSVSLPERRRLIFSPPPGGGDSWPLREIVDLNDNSVRFSYDFQGLLSSFVDTCARKYFLSYTASGLLQEVILESALNSRLGISLVRFEYDSDRNLAAAYDTTGVPSTYEYRQHHLVKYTNRAGGSSYFAYNAEGQCVNTWLDNGDRFRYLQFDSSRHTTRVTDSFGYQTIYRFNSAGLLTESIDALGNSVQTFYDPSNAPLYSETTQPAGDFMVYDAATSELSVLSQDGANTVYTLNDLNQAVTLKDAEGNTWTYEYDPKGNRTAAVTAAGFRWVYERDSRGLLSALLDPCGRRIRITRTAQGSSIQQEDDLGMLFQFEYNVFGNLVRVLNAAGHATVLEYDRRRRLTGITYPDKTVLNLAYDALGNLVRLTNGLGDAYIRHYDAQGKLVVVINPLGSRFGLEYDREERLIAAVNERGERTRYGYDKLGRLAELTLFDGQKEAYDYGDQGLRRTVTDGEGKRREFQYDSAGRLVAKRFPDGSVATFDYDRLGRLRGAENRTTKLAFSYSADGQLVAEQQDQSGIGYSYDPVGRLTRVQTSADYGIAYTYDKRGRLTEIVDGDGSAYTFAYDAANSSVKMLCPNGMVQSVEYDSRGRLARHVVTHREAGEILKRIYEYDPAGRLASERHSRPSRHITYQYDALDRLTGVMLDDEVIESYEYDQCGNMQASGGVTDFSYGPGNRLVLAGMTRYEHDNRGNIRRREAGTKITTYAYDADNQLIQIVDPEGNQTSFEYDALMRRTRKTHKSVVTSYRWSNETVIQETTAGGTPVEYLFFPFSFKPLAQTVGGERHEYVLDHLGAPVELVARRGASVWSSRLAAGQIEPSEGVSTPFRYPGQYFDRETGLTYNRTRYYDESIRRYLSQDPVRFRGGTNFYIYAANNPVNLIDPFGLGCYRAECDQLFKEMDNLTNQTTAGNPPSPGANPPPHGKGLVARAAELEANDPAAGGMGLPYERLPNDPHGQQLTIASHWDQYLGIQRGVNNRLQQWDDLGCAPKNTSNPTRAGRVVQDARYNGALDPPIPDYVGDPAAMFGLP